MSSRLYWNDNKRATTGRFMIYNKYIEITRHILLTLVVLLGTRLMNCLSVIASEGWALLNDNDFKYIKRLNFLMNWTSTMSSARLYCRCLGLDGLPDVGSDSRPPSHQRRNICSSEETRTEP